MTVNAQKAPVAPKQDGVTVHHRYPSRPLPDDMDIKQFSTTPQNIPSAITQYFLPPLQSFGQRLRQWKAQQPSDVNIANVGHQILYRPTILMQAQVHYTRPEQKINHQRIYSFQVDDLPLSGLVKWPMWRAQPVDPAAILPKPYGKALYIQPQKTMIDGERLNSLRPFFLEYVRKVARIEVPAIPNLGMIGFPDESPEQFQQRVLQQASQARDAELDELHRQYSEKLAQIESGFRRVTQSLEAEAEDSEGPSWFRWIETVYSFFRGNFIESLIEFLETKGRRQERSPYEVILSAEEAETQAEIDLLYERYHREADNINRKWAELTASYEQEVLVPSRDEVIVELFGLAWRPYFYTQINHKPLILPA